jgi:hypothetical protein
MCAVLTGIVLGTGLVVTADAGDNKKPRRNDARQERRAEPRRTVQRVEVRHGRDRYFRTNDVYVIREYYRPHYRRLPHGQRHRYYRAGYLPPGWAKKVRPVPVYIERELVAIPRGYRRSIIDGHVVVHNNRGFILDVAVLF